MGAQDYNGDWNIGKNALVIQRLKVYGTIHITNPKEFLINKIPPKLCTDNCMIYNPDYKL